MDVTIISQRYARAIFDLAREMNALEEVKEDMDTLREVTFQNPRFKRVMASPIIPAGKKNSILKGIFGKHFHTLTMRFLQLLTRKEREVYLREITESFEKLYKDHHNIITVTVTSTVALNKENREELLNLLNEQTHKTVDLVEEVDEELIGGFVIKMEDRKYDASIRQKLERLRKRFEKNLYVKEF
ncbi:MAG: ATP synthase F1 subunit delta [Bacteroidales bacterium]